MTSGTLAGIPGADYLVRQALGLDDEDDESLTVLDSFDPERVDGVDQPANGAPFLVMKRGARSEAGAAVAAARVVKAEAVRRYTLCLVYPASKPDVSVAQDGYRDFATAGAVQDAAWSFLQKGGQVGLMHAQRTSGAGDVVESYLWPGDEWAMSAADGSRQVIRKGDWLAGIVWSPKAWQLIKDGRVTGVSMQGTAVRRQPTRQELASLRKGAMKVQKKQLAKAVRAAAGEAFADPAVRASFDGITAAIASTGQRLSTLEKARGLRCAKCETLARDKNPRFCWECGARLGSSPAVKSAPPRRPVPAARQADVERLHRLVQKARSGDPAERDQAVMDLMRVLDPADLEKALSREALTGQDVAGFLVKAAGGDGDGDEAAPCRTCEGRGRLRHSRTGKPSKVCPACDGTGEQAPDGDDDEAPVSKGEEMHLAAVLQRAMAKDGTHLAAIGDLMGLVGQDMTLRLMGGGIVTPAEFRRAYITAGRTRLSAAPGQEPRIPQPTHVPEVTDFRRGPLGAGQSRPAPASAWPGDGGQQDYYQPGPGIPAHGSGVSTSTWTALAASHPLGGT